MSIKIDSRERETESATCDRVCACCTEFTRYYIKVRSDYFHTENGYCSRMGDNVRSGDGCDKWRLNDRKYYERDGRSVTVLLSDIINELKTLYVSLSE